MKNGQTELVLPVSEFKAKCLEILGRLRARTLSRVTVTRHGQPVAELYPPRTAEDNASALFAAMSGTVIVPPGLDLTEPVIDMSGWDSDPIASPT